MEVKVEVKIGVKMGNTVDNKRIVHFNSQFNSILLLPI